MPRISPQEFERLPLRVHDFLTGVPLHDVWAVDLPRARSGITLEEFLRTAKNVAVVQEAIREMDAFGLAGSQHQPFFWTNRGRPLSPSADLQYRAGCIGSC